MHGGILAYQIADILYVIRQLPILNYLITLFFPMKPFYLRIYSSPYSHKTVQLSCYFSPNLPQIKLK